MSEILLSLNERRQKLEFEALEITEELMSGDPPMGVDTPLVDAEGFPFPNVDVHGARILRHRLAILRTDHGALMKEIEDGLKKVALLNNPAAQAEEEQEALRRSRVKPKPKVRASTTHVEHVCTFLPLLHCATLVLVEIVASPPPAQN